MWRKLASLLAVALYRAAGRLPRYAWAADAASEIQITTELIGGWPPGTADAPIGRGATPAETARAFADALERVQ